MKEKEKNFRGGGDTLKPLRITCTLWKREKKEKIFQVWRKRKRVKNRDPAGCLSITDVNFAPCKEGGKKNAVLMP